MPLICRKSSNNNVTTPPSFIQGPLSFALYPFLPYLVLGDYKGRGKGTEERTHKVAEVWLQTFTRSFTADIPRTDILLQPARKSALWDHS